MKKLLLTLLVALVTFACKEKPPVRSSDYMASLPEGEVKRKLIMGCTSCHQMGVPVAIRNTKAEWDATITKMLKLDEDLKLHLIPLTKEDLVNWLTEHGSGPIEKRNTTIYSDVPVAKAKYEEFPLGYANGFYHDMALADDRAFVADYFGNKLYAINLKTRKTETFDIPVNVKPGKPGGAHAIDKTHDGKIWITFTKSEQVMEFDPTTNKFREYHGFTPGGNVQYFVLDANRDVFEDKSGNFWVSHFSKEILTQVNRATGKTRVFNTTRTKNMDEAAVHLYAAVADSKGRLWYTETHGNHMGFLDPATGKTWEKPMALTWAGPKRLSIDKNDMLWIPELATGKITLYDTRTEKIAGQIELPIKGDYIYAIRINPYNGDVWATGSGSDSLYRIDPKTRAVRVYRMPRRGTFTRTVVFDKEGNVYTCYGSLPNKHTQMPYQNAVVLKITPQD
ncbi:MAG: Virginiamycin B lyase [Turneriella sp.]|nr:Virginiamycin B lyase [Turneriella sp.]